MLFIIFIFVGGKRKGYKQIETFLFFENDNTFTNFPTSFGNTQFLSLRYFSQIVELFVLIECYFVYHILDSGKESSWIEVFMVFYRLFKILKKIKDIL